MDFDSLLGPQRVQTNGCPRADLCFLPRRRAHVQKKNKKKNGSTTKSQLEATRMRFGCIKKLPKTQCCRPRQKAASQFHENVLLALVGVHYFTRRVGGPGKPQNPKMEVKISGKGSKEPPSGGPKSWCPPLESCFLRRRRAHFDKNPQRK